MTNYQTTIQVPSAIRWGSAKIEIYNPEIENWIDLGALKSISATTTTNGEQKFEPDNAAPIVIDPTPDTWDWSAELQEAWNPEIIKLIRGGIDTFATSSAGVTVGVYAGSGSRPYHKFRITNTTPGQQAVTITLNKAKVTSELDFTFPTDKDGTTAVALPLTIKAEIDGSNGFGPMFIPAATAAVTITPTFVNLTPGNTQTMTVVGAAEFTFATLNQAVATVSTNGVLTGVSNGTTQLLIVADGVEYRIPVTVETV